MNYKFYLIDDDPSVIRILTKIIVDNAIGDVIGVDKTGDKALTEVKRYQPDIVIVDLLLPAIDGISLVHQINDIMPKLPMVMISEVQSKDMVSQAYAAGVEFYINKPINVIEVINVIKRVDEKLQMSQIISSFKSVFANISALNDDKPKLCDKHFIVRAKNLLSELGILSENGVSDILLIVDFLSGTSDGIVKRISDYRMVDLYAQIVEIYLLKGEKVQEKTVEQRIRRAVNQAMCNIAQIGLEDFEHEYFNRYAHTLFDYGDVRKEINHLAKRDNVRGKTNIKKFMTGLMQEIRRE